jgi:hypothetical protein
MKKQRFINEEVLLFLFIFDMITLRLFYETKMWLFPFDNFALDKQFKRAGIF